MMIVRGFGCPSWRWAFLVLSIAALVWFRSPDAASAQSVCGDGTRDFTTEDCDDGGRCAGGAEDGLRCTTVATADLCVGGANDGQACTQDADCPDGFCQADCTGGACMPVDGDLDFPVPGGARGDECPFDCTINDNCPSAETVDVTVRFRQTCPCAGDCDGNGEIDLNETIIGVGIGLGTRPLDDCPSFDENEDETVGVTELIGSVNRMLNECPETCGGTLDLTNGRFFFRYPDDKVTIPGQANDQSVIERIAVPFIGTSTPNDLDYALRIILAADFGFVIDPDALFTATMNVCEGSEPLAAEDFRCTVFEAFASDASDVTAQTTCSVEIGAQP